MMTLDFHKYFLKRFKSQYYQYGNYLPSIETMCREFGVSDKTVKTALQRLRTEGYISMHSGRQTQVLYRQTQDEMDRFALRFFSERWSAF